MHTITDYITTTAQQPLAVGTFVDPHVLPDFAGPVFALKEAKLIVNDLRHADNTIIHPADMYGALRTGTVVILTVSLTAWAMPGRNHGMKNRVCRFRSSVVYYHSLVQ